MSFIFDLSALILIPVATIGLAKLVEHLTSEKEPIKPLSAVAHHAEHVICSACELNVARYDDRGICANCVGEGK